MGDVTRDLTDSNEASLILGLTDTPPGSRNLEIISSRCLVHDERFGFSIGARTVDEPGKAGFVVTISACCEDFIDKVLERCRKARELDNDDRILEDDLIIVDETIVDE